MTSPATQFHIDHLNGLPTAQIEQYEKDGRYNGVCRHWLEYYKIHYKGFIK